jgi:hypothetical protein
VAIATEIENAALPVDPLTPPSLYAYTTHSFLSPTYTYHTYTMALPPKYQDEPTSNSTSPTTKSYGSVPPSSSSEPLIAQSSSSENANAWTHQPSPDDLPDDFKVGVNVIDCDAGIRLQFIRKVYSILFVQLLATALVSLAMAHPDVKDFVRAHGWLIWIPFLGSFASLGGVYWKRHQHPANLILLGLFTLFEAMMVGTITSYVEGKIVSSAVCHSALIADILQVLQALFITLGVFTGLTLFTFQTKVCSYPLSM